MISLPFFQTIYEKRKMFRVAGILTAGAEGLGVEWRLEELVYQTGTTATVPAARSEVRRALLPWGLVDDVRYRGGLITAGTIRVRARTMEAMSQLPVSDGPFWTVRVAKEDRRRARELALAAEEEIASAVRR